MHLVLVMTKQEVVGSVPIWACAGECLLHFTPHLHFQTRTTARTTGLIRDLHSFPINARHGSFPIDALILLSCLHVSTYHQEQCHSSSYDFRAVGQRVWHEGMSQIHTHFGIRKFYVIDVNHLIKAKKLKCKVSKKGKQRCENTIWEGSSEACIWFGEGSSEVHSKAVSYCSPQKRHSENTGHKMYLSTPSILLCKCICMRKEWLHVLWSILENDVVFLLKTKWILVVCSFALLVIVWVVCLLHTLYKCTCWFVYVLVVYWLFVCLFVCCLFVCLFCASCLFTCFAC